MGPGYKQPVLAAAPSPRPLGAPDFWTLPPSATVLVRPSITVPDGPITGNNSNT